MYIFVTIDLRSYEKPAYAGFFALFAVIRGGGETKQLSHSKMGLTGEKLA